jgi:Domain of unknown function (DUF222)
VTRELIRRRALPGGSDGDLPDRWEDDLSHEITPALGISLPAADKLANTAWEMGARLPGIGAALAAGTIDYLKGQSEFCTVTVPQPHDLNLHECECLAMRIHTV